MRDLHDEDLKYYVCAFKMKGHETWRILSHKTIEGIEKQLKTELGKNIVTDKRFYEIDRLNGNFEEF